MDAKIWLPRLTPRQIEELTLSLTRLDHIHDSVGATNMLGRPAVLQLCIEVYRSIESVLNGVHRAVQNAHTRDLPPGDRADPAPGDQAPAGKL